ncbi:MAG: IS4 family transposase, partial [Desulfobulbaceae bacterium]|nr:IS4 family transposase [Desulfobulbaceae bacterium]
EWAKELGFVKRDSAKFDPTAFLAVFCLKSQVDSPSYNDLAAKIEALYGISMSKQALWKRVNDPCVLFFQAILAKMIKHKFSQQQIDDVSKTNNYKRILIQDSTIIKIPKKLLEIFSGVSNGHSTTCNIRIQGVYELISGRFIDFSIDSYSKNDLSAAPELQIGKDDLVLRDRGYCSFKEIKRHVSSGAYCIFRHKMKFVYLNPVSDQPIDLMKLLRKNSRIDMVVCLNNEERTQVRLVAEPASDQIANQRRRKAKNEIKGHNPCEELLELMGYTVCITTIMDPEVDLDQIIKIYSLRWKIEIIFKIWKSHLSFDKVHNVSHNQLWVLLLARFMMILMYTHLMYIPYFHKVRNYCDRNLSMMKFITYIINNQEKIESLLSGLVNSVDNNKLLDTIVKYSAYDKRKRMNIIDLQAQVLLS